MDSILAASWFPISKDEDGGAFRIRGGVCGKHRVTGAGS